MVAPRECSVPEVRSWPTRKASASSAAVGVHHGTDSTARRRSARDARAIGGPLRRRRSSQRTPIAGKPCSTSASSNCCRPRSAAVSNAFVQTMIEHDIPIEAIVTELVLSGEVERTYRCCGRSATRRQSEFHSPTSQYGQLSRPRGAFDHLDVRGDDAHARRRHSGPPPTSGTPSGMRRRYTLQLDRRSDRLAATRRARRRANLGVEADLRAASVRASRSNKLDRVRIGIVGVGNIATLNVPGYLEHEQLRRGRAVRPAARRARAPSAGVGRRPRSTPTSTDLLADDDDRRGRDPRARRRCTPST